MVSLSPWFLVHLGTDVCGFGGRKASHTDKLAAKVMTVAATGRTASDNLMLLIAVLIQEEGLIVRKRMPSTVVAQALLEREQRDIFPINSVSLRRGSCLPG